MLIILLFGLPASAIPLPLDFIVRQRSHFPYWKPGSNSRKYMFFSDFDVTSLMGNIKIVCSNYEVCFGVLLIPFQATSWLEFHKNIRLNPSELWTPVKQVNMGDCSMKSTGVSRSKGFLVPVNFDPFDVVLYGAGAWLNFDWHSCTICCETTDFGISHRNMPYQDWILWHESINPGIMLSVK